MNGGIVGNFRGFDQNDASTDIAQSIAASASAPVDDHGAAGSEEDVLRMKVAMAHSISRRQLTKTVASRLFLGVRKISGAVDPAFDLVVLSREFGGTFEGMELEVEFGHLPGGGKEPPWCRDEFSEEGDAMNPLESNRMTSIHLDNFEWSWNRQAG